MAAKKGFVCQNCEKPVPPKTDRCPFCGRFFKGVRCPECHYIGVADDFTKGCPACGYLGDASPTSQYLYSGKKTKKEKPLPPIFYIISLGVLTAAALVFAGIIINL